MSFTRRQCLRLLAGAMFTFVATGASWLRLRAEEKIQGKVIPTLTPEEEEGPFYLNTELLRSDITEGRPGVPLALQIAVMNATTGAPLPHAAIDIWHCDAAGLYSAYTAMKGFGPPPDDHGPGSHGEPPPAPPPDFASGSHGPNRPAHQKITDKSTFLRGTQVTDVNGMVRFSTIYPGWYAGREIHIHLKVHLGGLATNQQPYAGGHVCHTGQLFFPDETNESISRTSPYALSTTERTTKQTDHVYRDQNGDQTVLKLTPASEGYLANITLAVDPLATPRPVGFGG